MQILIFVWCLQKLKPRHRPGLFCVCITATNVFRLMTSSIGTFETCRRTAKRSAYGGRPEVIAKRSERRF